MFQFTKALNAPKSKSVRVRVLLAAFAFIIFVSAAQSISAAAYTVTNTADSGAGSLRQAVLDANGTAANDKIVFNIPAASCASGVCTITLTTGLLLINDAATAGILLITNSTGASNLLISGGNASRAFGVNSGANLTLNGLTVTNGSAAGFNGGGIINNGGTLSLTNSAVSGNGNAAVNHGGGIYNAGTLSLTNSTVSGNTAGNNGGGIYNETGTTTLTNSTVSGNSGNYGGGIINSGGTLSLANSTVSGNTSFNGGGGIRNDLGTLNLTSSTVAYNSANNVGGGGVSNNGGIANLRNTIVAKNTANSPDFDGAIASTSTFNLIGDGTGMSGITNDPLTGNQVGTSGVPIDPKLNPALALNGGTTLNHALLSGSPAIDKGNETGTDQRGKARPIDNPNVTNAVNGNGSDIGSYEALAPSAASVSISGRVTTADGRGLRNAIVELTGTDGVTCRAITSSFGYYRFDNVRAGETYVVSVSSKRYQFATQIVGVSDDLTGVDFVAESGLKRTGIK